jgi:hypothetical protein
MSPSPVISEQQDSARPLWIDDTISSIERTLVVKYGEGQRLRLQRGLVQVATFWRDEDGDAAEFGRFVLENFAGDQEQLDTMFARFEYLLEQLDGHMHEISREFRQQQDLDLGTVLPFDQIFGGYDPGAHLLDDFFENKLAFTVLLNFPLTTLEERLTHGKHWSRRQWAEARLAQRFSKRIPAEVNLAIARAAAETDNYVIKYNIWLHHVLDSEGRRLFPPKLRLLCHWGLRDQLKADYIDTENGLAKQRTIQRVMERVITQTIPQAVIDNPHVDWNPYTNQVTPAAVNDLGEPTPKDLFVSSAPEPETRYAMLLKTFAAAKLVDPYSPTAPSLIARRFDEDREIPEARVKQMLEQVLRSPLVARIARLIQERLGRQLEPFDIWYMGFRPGSSHDETELDKTVAQRYPTAQAYQRDMPSLLMKLGFTAERALALAERIVVDPGRGAGHAMGAAMRSEKAHLRTRVEKSGMNYKGFSVAAHEMGHNVEQTISLVDVDHTLLSGVPNTACTEAFAFIFQGHDLELLGIAPPDTRSEALKTIHNFWATFEIAGVALVDMAAWHWMYDHPEANPQQLRDAMLEISKEIWNRYYAPVFGRKDAVLLGVYSHIIDAFMYLPDYPIGHLIAFQIEEQMKKAGNIGSEVERIAKMGRVSPDMWMENATGKPVGAEALLAATERALNEIGGG